MTGSRRVHHATAAIAAIVFAWVAFAALQANAGRVSGSLTTTFAGGNSSGGATFDLQVLPRGGIVVKRLDVNVVDEGDSGQVQLWTRPGTAVGFEGSDAGWTSRGSVEVTADGAGARTPVPLSFSLPQGSHGVAIGAPGSNPDIALAFTSDIDAEPDTFEDGVLRLAGGSGLGTPIFDGGGVTAGRIWNGTIYYKVPCEAAKKKLKKVKQRLKKAKRELQDAKSSGDPGAIAKAAEKVDNKQNKKKKAQRKKKRACS